MIASTLLADQAGEDTHSAFPEPTAADADIDSLPLPLQVRFVAWLRQSGQLDRAAATLDRIERHAGDLASVQDELAALALAARDLDRVRACWDARLRDRPYPSARAAFARALLELGETAEASAIVEDLLTEHWELMTVQSLAAELALQHGDLAAARDYWSTKLAEDASRVSPQLALVRLALLAGDAAEARTLLDRALADPASFTPAQLATAAALAELLAQSARAQSLRHRYARLEAVRTAALAAEIDAALGRTPGMLADIPLATEPSSEANPAPQPAPPDAETEPDGAEIAPLVVEEPLADPRVLEALRDVFGFETTRPGQAAVINRVLAGRDTLAILPTGAGKSLTFQLPALLLAGTTLVLSPLIALMKDQVEGLPPALRRQTVLVNSTLSPDEQRRALDEIAQGAYKLVYAAPERLRQHAFLRALRQSGVSLVVVDEAHCISLWGHDFRPDYLTIPSALPELGDPPVLAITATATPRMEAAIAAGFGRDLDRVRTSVFRPNLHYEVHRLPGREQKVAKVLEICRQERGAGIVYVSSRKDAEAIAALLRDRGVGAVAYHAGLDPTTRARAQERFMAGQARVVVATVAFGMGIDKRDVRFIVHLNPPRSLEAYAQESGRAGRDGLPARCVLLTAPADKASLNRLARRDELDIDTLRSVYSGVKRAARGQWAVVDPGSLLPPSLDDDPDDEPDPRIALGLLDQAKLLRRHPDAPVTYTLRLSPPLDAAPEPGAETDPRHAGLAAWAGLDDPDRSTATIRTADACDELGLSPLELGRLIASHPALTAREGPRLVCLELLPVATDAAARLNEILARARREAQTRVRLVMDYTSGVRCRHAMLAAHLGESLPPCGVSCDNCLARAAAAEGEAPPTTSDSAPITRSRVTADDALAVLNAVRTLPFPMGKTGLTKLLLGSVESRVRGDRSPAFGALAELKKGKVEGLIDRLVEDGLLLRDLDHEYKVIRLTARGAAAGRDDLSVYDDLPVRTGSFRPGAIPGDDAELSPEDEALLQRLQEWRGERAARDAVPAYVVAHNTWLVELAQRRPQTLEDLSRNTGFGPSRVEKYGEEILAVIAAAEATLASD